MCENKEKDKTQDHKCDKYRTTINKATWPMNNREKTQEQTHRYSNYWIIIHFFLVLSLPGFGFWIMPDSFWRMNLGAFLPLLEIFSKEFESKKQLNECCTTEK